MMPRSTASGRSLVPALALSLAFIASCQPDEEPEPPVARVGSAELQEQDIQASLATIANTLDSVDARQRLVDQWIDSELLYQEAQRRSLSTETAVQRRLDESARAVLIDAMVSRLMEEGEVEIRPNEVLAYYERHKEQLRLREPFVRLHYLSSANADSVRAAHDLLRQAEDADTLFLGLVARFSEDASMSLSLASSYVPESQLFGRQPAVAEAVRGLQPGEIAPVLDTDGVFHLVRLADRAAAGSTPELAWVEDVVRQQLAVEARKRLYERQIQRLRMEALSRDRLQVN